MDIATPRSRPSRVRAERVLPVMVIGISGATWTVIDPMLAAGELPNLRALIRQGSRGVLESVKAPQDKHYRPQTAWPSIFTGRLPEGHGITEYFHTSRNLRSPCVWDHFNAQGLGAGLYSAPISWPPPRINGFVVPSLYARDARAWPEELSSIAGYYRRHQDAKLRPSSASILLGSARFLPLLFGPGRDWRTPVRLARSAVRLASTRQPETRALALRHAKLDFSMAMFLHLCRKFAPRLSIFTSFEVDYISHRFWRYHEPDKFPAEPVEPAPLLKRAVRDAYARMDRCIGQALRRFPADGIVAVVSEHGMAAEVPSSEIGKWRYMIDARKLRALAGIGEEVVGVPIARWVAFRREDGGPLGDDVARSLASMKVAETGAPLFKTHFHAEDEVVVKLDLQRAHHVDVDDIGTLHVELPDGRVVPIVHVLRRAGRTRSAMHRKEGVLIVKGPSIRSGFEVQGAVVTDVMPTLLRAAGLETPSGLDGKALDLFD